MTILEAAKLALRVTVDDYDAEITSLIAAAEQDLMTAGVAMLNDSDPLIRRAILTYCRMHFGSPPDYDRLRESYNAQLSKLMYCTEYTDYPDEGEDDQDDACW